MRASSYWPDVIREYSSQLYSLALQTLGRREDAEDVVQEAFLRAYVAVERRGVRIHTSMRAWLARITINLCYDRLRSHGYAELPAGSGSEALSVLAQGPADRQRDDPGPEELAIRGEALEGLADAVRRLPENHRTAVVLRYGLDLSYREIAQVLEVPENTVATWLRRAHLALRSRAELKEASRCTAG